MQQLPSTPKMLTSTANGGGSNVYRSQYLSPKANLIDYVKQLSSQQRAENSNNSSSSSSKAVMAANNILTVSPQSKHSNHIIFSAAHNALAYLPVDYNLEIDGLSPINSNRNIRAV